MVSKRKRDVQWDYEEGREQERGIYMYIYTERMIERGGGGGARAERENR